MSLLSDIIDRYLWWEQHILSNFLLLLNINTVAYRGVKYRKTVLAILIKIIQIHGEMCEYMPNHLKKTHSADFKILL